MHDNPNSDEPERELPVDDQRRDADADGDYGICGPGAGPLASDEVILAFVEQIDRGVWPLEVPFALENAGDFPQIKLQTRFLVSLDEPKTPHEIVRGTMRWGRARISTWMAERIERQIEQGKPPLVCLFSLCAINPQRFLSMTAEYLASTWRERAASGPKLSDIWALAIRVHEVDPQLLSQLVQRTRAIEDAAGNRLRSVLVDLTCDPFFADRIGLLSAAALRERLEET